MLDQKITNKGWIESCRILVPHGASFPRTERLHSWTCRQVACVGRAAIEAQRPAIRRDEEKPQIDPCLFSTIRYYHTQIHTLHYITLYYIILYYITLYYIILHYIHAYMHTCMNIYICIYIYMHIYMHIYICIYIYDVYIYIYVYVYVCICIYTYVLYILYATIIFNMLTLERSNDAMPTSGRPPPLDDLQSARLSGEE